MAQRRLVRESDLANLAQAFRVRSGRNKTQAANELKVSRPSIHHAEKDPDQSLSKLRRKIIERYSPYKVVGPLFLLRRKAGPSR